MFSLLLGCQKSAPNQTGEERNAPPGAANARPTRLRRRRSWSTTKQRCRDGGIRSRQASSRRRAARGQICGCVTRCAHRQALLGDRPRGLARERSLRRFAPRDPARVARARSHRPCARTGSRTAHRAAAANEGAGRLTESGAGEAADRRGNFAAARYPLTCRASGPGSCALRWSRLQVSPRLMRAAYLRMRPSLWTNQAVAAH